LIPISYARKPSKFNINGETPSKPIKSKTKSYLEFQSEDEEMQDRELSMSGESSENSSDLGAPQLNKQAQSAYPMESKATISSIEKADR
jgi:hypothetical protein